jgi:hypothetical protein
MSVKDYMKIKGICLAMFALGLAAATSAPTYAQTAGIRAGIANSAPQVAPPMAVRINPPIQPFVSSPVTAFGMPPTFFQPSPFVHAPFIPAPVFRGPHGQFGHHRRNPVTVIAPGAIVIAPGAVVVNPGFATPAPIFVQPIGPTVIPSPGPIGVNRPRPLPGATRAQVITQFGQPHTSVFTSTQETLQFSGGVVVILQNGLVVR